MNKTRMHIWGVIKMGDYKNDCGCNSGGIFGGGWEWIIIVVVVILIFFPGIFNGGGCGFGNNCGKDPCC